ncbi:MAG: hypothetical protein M1812_002389 [Candelaria pacifica]|nr:MAG: hypothetical protein M1812_002389 [Candelaria pacifica]
MRFLVTPSNLKGSHNDESDQSEENILPFDERTESIPLRDHDQHATSDKDGQKAASKYNLHHVLSRWWLWEVLSCILALAALVAIYGTLYAYNGRQLPDWPSGITLNALIALLSAVLRAAMLVPVVEGLSQLKWVWYRQEHSLQDFGNFDAASRGPWGAARMLFLLRRSHLASLGAFITIAALAMDPFAQQVIRYAPAPRVVSDHVSLPRTNYLQLAGARREDTAKDVWIPGIGRETSSATYRGIWGDTGLHVPYICPTGNCTFPPYQSLGVCTKHTNITGLLNRTCSTTPVPSSQATSTECNYTLPNGMDFREISRSDRKQSDSVQSRKISITNRSNIADNNYGGYIFNFAGIFATWDTQNSWNEPWAVESMGYWCIKTYNTMIRDGVFIENITSTQRNNSAPGFQPYPPDADWKTYNGSNTFPPFVSGQPFASPEPCLDLRDPRHPKTSLRNCTYSVAENTWAAWAAFFPFFFQEHQADIGLLMDNGGHSNISYVRGIIDNLATSLTSHIRSLGTGIPVYGDMRSTHTFVRVQWVWLAYPIALVVFSIIFLISTIVKSAGCANQEVWKSSPLALLYHGFHTETRERLSSLNTLEEMEMNSQKVRVTLSKTDRIGWKLVN